MFDFPPDYAKAFVRSGPQDRAPRMSNRESHLAKFDLHEYPPNISIFSSPTLNISTLHNIFTNGYINYAFPE